MNIRKILPALLLILPFLKPDAVQKESILDYMYQFGAIVSFLIVLIAYLFFIKKVSIMLALIVAYRLWLFVPSVLFNNDIYRCARDFLFVIGACAIAEMIMKKDFTVYCRSILIPLITFSVVNTITVFMYPEGMYFVESEYGYYWSWFLGHYNAHIIFMLPAIYFSLLLSHFRKNKRGLNVLILLIISAMTVFITWSATSIISIVMIAVFIFIIYAYPNSRIFNILNYSIITVAAILAIIVFRLQENFSYIIEDLLNRSVTFTGRTILWDRYIYEIGNNPIIGYGVGTADKLYKTVGYQGHGHNYYINLMYQGGLVALALFVIMIFLAGKKLYIRRSNQFSNILSYLLLVFFITAISEVYNEIFIYQLFLMGYHIENIIKQQRDYMLVEDRSMPIEGNSILKR